ncbi:hypothetical protein L208DRAFT_1405162 [Tricholoma matsutake]|nr:hypothetical protein L208DRAFT_1405162 [Tricholoma matsutake 945]
MLQSSGKHAASSPLGSKFDKKKCICYWIRDFPYYVLLNAEDVSMRALALALQQVASKVLDTSHALTLDKSWLDAEHGKERINLLPCKVQLDLASIWVEACDKGEWERFANHSLLQVETPTIDSDGTRAYACLRDDQVAATMKSWEYPFQGNTARGLWEHIETHYNPSDDRNHFVIPLNLWEATSTGYPPADHSIQDYLTTTGSKDVAYDCACAFLKALCKHTTDTLRSHDLSLEYVEFARGFKSSMTEGQKMTGHNQFWEHFYKQVIEKARQLETERVHNIQVRYD